MNSGKIAYRLWLRFVAQCLLERKSILWLGFQIIRHINRVSARLGKYLPSDLFTIDP